GKNGNLDKYLKGQRFRLCLHPTGKGAFGFLIAIAFNNEQFLEFIEKLKPGTNHGGNGLKKRFYSGVELYEIQSDKESKAFTFALYENV
ncbi:hypothetical protein R0J90_17135, partial [Micrococcus sp. SIMBA_144]